MALPKLRLVLLSVITGLLTSISAAQTCLDDYCYLTTQYSGNMSASISKGYRAFVLDSSIEEADLIVIRDFLEKNPEEKITLLLKSDDSDLVKQLSNVGLEDLLFAPSEPSSILGLEIDKSDQLVVFSESQARFLPLSKHIWWQNEVQKIPHDSLITHLTYLTLSNTSTFEQGQLKINNLIHRNGRLPNFLETSQPDVYKDLLDSLNRINWYKAIVLRGQEILKEIFWKELPSLESSGKIHVTTHILSPEKSGYRFSPDVSTYTADNEKVIKIFNASDLEVNEGLIMRLNFDENVVNQINPQDLYQYELIEYDQDEERGTYAKFDGQSHYIDFGVPSGMNFREITVSAWVKPDTLNGNKSIVGIGEVFSAKFRESKLTFTTPAIMDHETDSTIMKQDQWQQVAFVYKANKEVNFYYNGSHVGQQQASDMTITSHSLLIGSNLWSEYFQGGMDDLYIWDRALSDQEVYKMYQKGLLKNQKKSGLYLLGYLASALFLFFLVWMIRRKKQKYAEPVKFRPHAYQSKNQPGVYLFGGFKLINKDGKDLSPLFSPKRKELFVLILLYTFRKNGISSKQMSDILWEGHSFESAKNNRSTQVKRIREILTEHADVSIEYDQKNWKVILSDGLYWDFSDYYHFKNELKKSLDAQTMASNVIDLLDIINQGILLPNMHYEWLDPIKGQLSEEIIETLTQLLEDRYEDLDATIKLKLTNAIFSLDPLNEQALRFKIEILISEGKHTLAKNAYNQFNSAYEQFYGEQFDQEYSTFH